MKPPSRPLHVVLHVGMGKTGTSSIQYFLRDNRERLAAAGWLYPETPGRARHLRLSLFAKSREELESSPEWKRQKQTDPAAFRRAFRRRLLSEIEGSGLSQVLFSEEVLFGASRPTLRRLGRFTDDLATTLRVVVYLRRQDDHMVSRYQQGVKIGWVSRLSEFVQEDMSDLYDYAARLRRHQRLLSPTELVVRRFEPEAFVGGSLEKDFLAAAGPDLRVEDLEPAVSRNLSLDAESVELLRLVNLVRSGGEAPGAEHVDNRDLVPRLAEASSGPVLTLPDQVLDRFMEQWEESNSRVARRWFDEPGGRLFRPRRDRAGTTEQRFDPARLDRFLELLELPEHLHAPLRRVAEREAASR